MSIYIKGVKMPTEHPLWIVVSVDGTVQYNYWNEWKTAENKAVAVPPHGRLGDLDKLAEGCDEPYWCRWLSEIQDAPTIIPAESEGE